MEENSDKIIWVPTENIIPHPKNPNEHSKEQIEDLKKSISFYGWKTELLISKRSGLLIVGHGRLMAAKELGHKLIPVTYKDFDSEDEEYGYMIADNSISKKSELNLAMINEDIQHLDGQSFDLGMLFIDGFDVLPPEEKKPKKIKLCYNCGAEQ